VQEKIFQNKNGGIRMLTHKQLVRRLAQGAGVTIKDTDAVLKELQEVFWDEILKKEEFRLRKIGRFKLIDMPGLGTSNYRVVFKKPMYLYIHKDEKDNPILVNSNAPWFKETKKRKQLEEEQKKEQSGEQKKEIK